MNVSLLGSIPIGASARVLKIKSCDLQDRLMEMGFLEGTWVKVIHQAPVSRDPIAVQVRGAVIALRRQEANQVEVILDEIDS